MTTTCGFIAIIGEPNAGKSTLINQLVGGKVSIVSPKVQTTRFNIRGVCVHQQAQLIFVDTPGIFDATKKFETAMVNAAWAGISDADAVLMLLDAERGLSAGALAIIERLKQAKKPAYLAINKIDAVEKAKLLELAKVCDAHAVFTRIFMISALKNNGVEDVLKALGAALPEGEWLYPADQMSDISLRLLAAEVTREKLFLRLNQELPYSIFVETEKYSEEKTITRIDQAIIVQREGQKKIVIGKGGETLKHVGMAARIELEQMLGTKVHLALFVKVKPDWKDDGEYYKAIGLEFKK